MVEGAGFRKLVDIIIQVAAKVGHCTAEQLLPDRTTISRRTIKKATELRSRLKEIVYEVSCDVNETVFSMCG